MKYVIKSKWCSELQEEVDRPLEPLIFENNDPIPTGILDKNGYEYYRVNERQPIGFKLNGKQFTKG